MSSGDVQLASTGRAASRLPLLDRLAEHLELIYPARDCRAIANRIFHAFWTRASLPRRRRRPLAQPLWSQRDSVLITYGNTVVNGRSPPLAVLHDFLHSHLRGAVTAVHILPFFPFSSDDGFAVIDYESVNPVLGDWSHVSRIASDFRLMADLVLNHASSDSRWFKQFLRGEAPGRDYFCEGDPAADLSDIVRPRPSPLLRRVETASGERYVWCTFGPDQVDLDFANPDVLIEFVRILRRYIDEGVRMIRLDAVAFLWKQQGSACIHLPQTHEIIRLMRTLVDYCEEEIVLITETNVPSHENLSYFGNRNEAHIIYNFSLPPLMLHALLAGKSDQLRLWMMSMPPAPSGCTYLNFTASHDGIGLRPVEGLLDEAEVEMMIDTVCSFGGRVSMRGMAGGKERPYELNVSLFDALRGTGAGPDEWHFERFICSQTIMMALEGIPAFYLNGLLATPNDHELVERTGHKRSINRHQWDHAEIEALLADPSTINARVLNEIRRRLAIRCAQPAFHPGATQFTLQLGSALFGFWRQSRDRDQSIFAIANLRPEERSLPLHSLNLISGENWSDLLTGKPIFDTRSEIMLSPYQCLWLTNRP